MLFIYPWIYHTSDACCALRFYPQKELCTQVCTVSSARIIILLIYFYCCRIIILLFRNLSPSYWKILSWRKDWRMRTLVHRALVAGERLVGILLSIQRHRWQPRFAPLHLIWTKFFDLFPDLGLCFLFAVCCPSLNSDLYSDNSARTRRVPRGGCQNSRGI